jgi:hypothetical protein
MPVKIAISPSGMANPPSNYQRRMSSTSFYADAVVGAGLSQRLKEGFLPPSAAVQTPLDDD